MLLIIRHSATHTVTRGMVVDENKQIKRTPENVPYRAPTILRVNQCQVRVSCQRLQRSSCKLLYRSYLGGPLLVNNDYVVNLTSPVEREGTLEGR